MTWNEFCALHKVDGEELFSPTCVQGFGDLAFEPSDADRKAAGCLHIELVSRVATQKLDYLTGTEQAALSSLHQLFGETRKISEKHPDGYKFETLVWDALNQHLRPFTAKWHREATAGTLAALDSSDEFRGELDGVQRYLRALDFALLHIRNKQPPSPSAAASDSRDKKIKAEMRRSVAWGIMDCSGNIPKDAADSLNTAERPCIEARRAYYGIGKDEPKTHATALALSGGGIRSATFSLGVLVALARRGILPQFDYLSTVSGGGYLGSFLTTYLKSGTASPEGEIGLRPEESPFHSLNGESEPLRHLRHGCSYLTTGSPHRRLLMLAGQLQGMVLNGIGLALVAATIAFGEAFFHVWTASWEWPRIAGAFTLLLLFGFVVTMALGWANRGVQRMADWICLAFLLFWLGCLGLWGIEAARDWLALHWDRFAARSSWQLLGSIALVGGLPVAGSLVIGLFGRLLGRKGLSFVAWTASSSIILFFGLILVGAEFIARRSGVAPTVTTFASGQCEIIAIALFAGWLIYLFAFDINHSSPHRHYRNSLARTFLIQSVKSEGQKKSGARNTPSAHYGRFEQGVRLLLSSLRGNMRAPYHLINCALNVPATNNVNVQGRRTDFFLFSSCYCGSPLTGYEATENWESANSHLDIGTAMAISGAAASPLMGLGSLNHVRFWLALLNVRLGYWLKKPNGRRGLPGLTYLLQEMTGYINEKRPRLNLSDGGHIENLGVYELLRRRCQFIVAVDGEQDREMTFAALTTLQRLAAIDLNIKIDINLDDLRLGASGLSRSHFRLARIQYPKSDNPAEKEFGYLLYVKLSLTGNEGEFIRRYRRDEPAFPHHSTADQFFSELQFEAYRSLGEHVGDKLFLKTLVGEVGSRSDVTVEEWFRALGQNLLEPV